MLRRTIAAVVALVLSLISISVSFRNARAKANAWAAELGHRYAPTGWHFTFFEAGAHPHGPSWDFRFQDTEESQAGFFTLQISLGGKVFNEDLQTEMEARSMAHSGASLISPSARLDELAADRWSMTSHR
jgi:hypothetical protein